MTKPNKNKHIDTENRVMITKGKGDREKKIGKGGPQQGDGFPLNFRWCVHYSVYKNQNIINMEYIML